MTEFTTWRSLVDGDEISDIPDSENLHFHYDAQEAFDDGDDGNEINSWSDETVNGFDLSGGSPTVRSDGINGNLALEFDGTDDTLTIGSDDWDSISQVNTIYIVLEPTSGSNSNAFDHNDGDDERTQLWYRGTETDGWRSFAGESLVSDDTTIYQQITTKFDGANSLIRGEGTEIVSGDAGTQGIDSFRVGSQTGGNRMFDGYIGEILGYDADHDSTTMGDVESYLFNRWGITN